mgnify:FL=1
MPKITVRNDKFERQFSNDCRRWRLRFYCGQLQVAEILALPQGIGQKPVYIFNVERYNPTQPDYSPDSPTFSTVGEAMKAVWAMLDNPLEEQQKPLPETGQLPKE